MNRIDAVHPATPRRDLPPFRAGDTVRVHVSITEGDKQRIQVFEGGAEVSLAPVDDGEVHHLVVIP